MGHLRGLGIEWTRGGARREPRESEVPEGGVRRGKYKEITKGKMERNLRWIHICAMDGKTPPLVSIQRRTKGNTQMTQYKGEVIGTRQGVATARFT